jgi:hypothetical protein
MDHLILEIAILWGLDTSLAESLRNDLVSASRPGIDSSACTHSRHAASKSAFNDRTTADIPVVAPVSHGC